MADPGQHFAEKTTLLFNMRSDFPSPSDEILDVLMNVLLPSTATVNTTKPLFPPAAANTIASSSHLTDAPGNLLSFDSDWDFNEYLNFDSLNNMDFPFTTPSESTSNPTAQDPPIAAVCLPGLSHFPSHVTASTLPDSAIHSTSPTVISLNDSEGYCPPCPTICSTSPAVISLNDSEGYHPPCPPPLVPSCRKPYGGSGTLFIKSASLSAMTMDDSNSDVAAACLFSRLDLKCKTLDVSSKDMDVQAFFSTEPASTSATSALKAPQGHKHAWTTAASRVGNHDSEDEMGKLASAAYTISEEKAHQLDASHQQWALESHANCEQKAADRSADHK